LRWPVETVFVDAGTSGSLSAANRPVLMEAIIALKRGDVLLVAKRDSPVTATKPVVPSRCRTCRKRLPEAWKRRFPMTATCPACADKGVDRVRSVDSGTRVRHRKITKSV
jgi:hypothetical protein